ncbi:hypothetical protein BV898_04253 [Hypsibius exemplaris]|uniref:Uncharacterized protein n=1 Tax=Hypsibius exemplaris TaxID=2072580 RepID=A0A1W0X2G9_HYPEX|nr:hypothetical protein BV898_04253 [Hypsibius exemplaris]
MRKVGQLRVGAISPITIMLITQIMCPVAAADSRVVIAKGPIFIQLRCGQRDDDNCATLCRNNVWQDAAMDTCSKDRVIHCGLRLLTAPQRIVTVHCAIEH